jgi:hypothetical protein
MRALGRTITQAAVSLLLAGVLIPAAVYAMPTLGSRGAGPYVLVGVPIAVFVLIRMVWPHKMPS